MATKSIFALGVVAFAFLVSAAELGYTINGSYAALVLAAAVSALYFSMVSSATGGSFMANQGESLEIKTPVGSVKVPGGILTNNSLLVLILVMQCAQAWFMYQHHVSTEEATRESNYIQSLSQEQRDKLNLPMPESLRKRIKARE